jgi:3-dehydroquinate dehydratase-2
MVINGANLNMLGIREPSVYGNTTYLDLVNLIEEKAKERNIEIKIVQSNHEGVLVDYIQQCYFEKYDGIIINPGAYTHTSIALLDALKAVNIPAIEVHISDVSKREDFRQISYISLAVIDRVIGKGINGYIEAMDILINKLK